MHLESAHLLILVQDLTWGLMRPVAGTTKRASHFMHTPQFIPPVGFNAPVEAENWLSCGSLVLRRCILYPGVGALLEPNRDGDRADAPALAFEVGQDPPPLCWMVSTSSSANSFLLRAQPTRSARIT